MNRASSDPWHASKNWRARVGSNHQPSPSEGDTLSIELRAPILCRRRQSRPGPFGGETGIRTQGRGLSPYKRLAGVRLRPLGHLSVYATDSNDSMSSMARTNSASPYHAAGSRVEAERTPNRVSVYHKVIAMARRLRPPPNGTQSAAYTPTATGAASFTRTGMMRYSDSSEPNGCNIPMLSASFNSSRISSPPMLLKASNK